ncbi:MAG TPA: acyltransferase [Acetobacteraceae bacterium]|jgi:predicted LPLAT superfamily acyltransferase|nr:acyltransferase [Acetobacteraceae bacterium]
MTTPSWSQRRERGSGVLVRLMIVLSLKLGWAAGQALLYPITLYFYLFSPTARSASRGFLARVLPRSPGGADILRHIFSFSCVLLDRIFLLSNRTDGFAIDTTGLDDVTAALDQSRGCLLLGAHLGSFEALRCFGRQSPVPVKVLMYRANGGAYTDLVEALDPALCEDIIEIGTPEAMLRVHESLQRGEIVGVLGDRAPRGEKLVTVPFLGDPAPFPIGPLLLSAALTAPVVLFFGIRTGPRRYTLHFEHFADRIALDRGNRAAQTASCVQLYASRLEHFCRRYPFNWFNFYDFWDSRLASSTAPHSASLRDAVSPVAAGTGSERFSAAD